MDRSTRFWDRMAERYNSKPVDDETAYERRLEATRDYFRPDMEMLEFGCGTGTTAIAHAPFVRQVLATDFSSKMLGIARRKAAAASVGNVRFEQSSIDEFDAPGESFDAILCLSVLHLLRDRDAAIAKIGRLLKPGGIFVSSTVCMGDTMRFFKLIAPLARVLGVLPMLSVFTREELLASIARAGLVIEHESLPGKGKSVFVVARKS
jgi:ubiquinone/menaquinone biosynthesis C-methylase UbiE